ncbi:MAG: DUF47 family protein [Lachnospiraceae bacterium]|nr:DUF47 family protein [Lachnospiraceae bacterium]
MKEKKDEFYYKNLNACIDYSYQAAQFLKETLEQFQIDMLQEQIAEMHEIEQKADTKRHKMTKVLSKAFITPIEREDLVALSSNLDDITDAVEEVMLQIYMSNVSVIRPDVFPMLNLLLDCIKALGDVLKELKDFKHSKKIEEYIIRVNDLEEQGDKLYLENMYQLHKEKDTLLIVSWRKIYGCLENCLDSCEHTADIVETVIMKNS